jgi:hypothetical protein
MLKTGLRSIILPLGISATRAVVLSVAIAGMGVALAAADASQSRFLKSIKIDVSIRSSTMPVKVAVDVERVLVWKHGEPYKLLVVPVRTYLVTQAGQQDLVVPVTNAVRRASYAPASAGRLNGQIQLDVYAYHAPRLSFWTESDWVLKKQAPSHFPTTPFHLWRWRKVPTAQWQALS